MIHISSEINYIEEAISLLCMAGKGKSYETYCQEQVRSLCSNPEEILKEKKNYISLLTKIEKAFRKEFSSDMKEIVSYFSPFSKENDADCLGRILLLYNGYVTDDTLRTYEQYETFFSGMDEKSYNKRFSFLLQNISNNFINSADTQGMESAEEIIQYILTMDYAKEILLQIEEGFLNRKKHLEILLGYIKRTAKVLQSFEQDLKNFLLPFTEEWNQITKEKDLIQFLTDIWPILSKYGDILSESKICPCYMSPFKRGFGAQSENDEIDTLNTFILSLGLFYGKNMLPHFPYDLPDSNKDKEHYLTILKSMSDPNRFKILSMIKDKPAYSTELSKELGLTNATMSHHANQLLSNYLVTLELDGTKSYYSSNKETIKDCINFLRESLL